MEQQKFFTPLKIGLLVVVISYFLFTLHATFTLEWLGEWDRIAGGAFRTAILVEDVTAFICLLFRFAASIVALAAVTYYFVKKSISKPATYKILRVVLIFEAVYWLGLAATTVFTVEGFARALSSRPIAIGLRLTGDRCNSKCCRSNNSTHYPAHFSFQIKPQQTIKCRNKVVINHRRTVYTLILVSLHKHLGGSYTSKGHGIPYRSS